MAQLTREAAAVALVDESELFRAGLRATLEGAGMRVVQEWGSAAAVLEGPDLDPGTVVLCSLTLAGWQETVEHLFLRSPACPILGVVDEVTEKVVIEALWQGILSCVGRSLTPEQWVESVRQTGEGKVTPAGAVVRFPGIARHVLMTLSQPAEPPGLSPLSPGLGDRERLALSHLSEGISTDAIAQRLGVAPQALEELLASACRKLVARHRLARTLDRLR